MSDLVKALEDLLEHPSLCEKCASPIGDAPPVNRKCRGCKGAYAARKSAHKTLAAIPVLTWKKRKDGVRVARLYKWTLDVVPLPYEPPHKFAWTLIMGSSWSSDRVVASGLGITLAQAKRRAVAALRKECVVFRTVRK